MNSDDNDETLGPGFPHLVGQDPASEEEKEGYIKELVRLKKIDAIAYEKRRNVIARLIACNKGTLDTEVKARIKAEADDDGDVVRDLLEIGMAQELWHSDEEGFATVECNGHLEHHRIDHPRFRAFLSREFGKIYQRDNGKGAMVPVYPTQNELKEAIYQLNLYAIYEGVEHEPRVRLNYVEGALWLDLGRSDWKCVRITADGWKILDRCEAKIIRGKGAKELPIPIPGGDIRDLRNFVNVRDEPAFALFVGQAVGQYNVFGNYTTTFFCGPAGSAKTSAMRVMRMLVDPHEVMERRFSIVRDLMHGLANHHVLALENVSQIKPDLSDTICALNTGTGYAERKYYSQNEEFQARGHMPVHVNGIPGRLAELEDLIDRAVTFAFEFISDENRKSADGFKRAFEAAWPKLLGCVLDGVVGALRTRQDFQDDNDAVRKELLGDYNPRFVDHVVWGEAACRKLGFRPGVFSEAYRENQGFAVQWFAEHDPICIGISEMMSSREEWEGKPEELYHIISPLALRHEERFEGKFPATSAVMGKELPRSIGALHKVHGIALRRFRLDDGNKNGIKIWKVGKGRQFASPDEGAEKEEPSSTF
jgi:hypothetical protein